MISSGLNCPPFWMLHFVSCVIAIGCIKLDFGFHWEADQVEHGLGLLECSYPDMLMCEHKGPEQYKTKKM